MTSKTLESKTLEELRALARAAGLRGYSGLRKKQLIELLNKPKARSSADAPARPTKPKKAAKSKSTVPGRVAKPKMPAEKSARPDTGVFAVDAEERIESAKYEMTPPGVAFAPPRLSDLHEDIDRLPAPHEPMLCLLPQKPGVVHAYWVLQPGAAIGALKLRLCAMGDGAIDILEEVGLPSERGHWYFHVPEDSHPGDLLAHLGYYDPSGKFVTAIDRGIARIPSFYASARTDRAWWIGDEDFRAMYLRAGGVQRGKRLAWGGAAPGSPVNAPSSRSK